MGIPLSLFEFLDFFLSWNEEKKKEEKGEKRFAEEGVKYLFCAGEEKQRRKKID